MRRVAAILRLTRLDSALLGFLALFLPLFTRSRKLGPSVGQAIPVLLICMCTFIANDLDDIESDRINHPERPLPAGRVTPSAAAVVYFACLALALFSTKFYAGQIVAFWYYALVTVSISYRYVVDWLPSVKAPYVAGAISVPVLIAAASYPSDGRLRVAVGAVFLFATGRELCMDIKDRPGDAVSFVQMIAATRLSLVAFTLQALGLVALGTQIRTPTQFTDLVLMIVLLAAAAVSWFKHAELTRAITLMKIQFAFGLYFLV